jgi:hypothetical protein
MQELRVPFRRRPLDLVVLTFDESWTEQFGENANEESFIELCDTEIKMYEELNIPDYLESLLYCESFLRPDSEYLPSPREVIFEDIIEIHEEISFELRDMQDSFSYSSRARRYRRRRGMLRVRRTRTKRERMMAKLTKRLSSSNSPLKRTRWNNGKRVREKRP